MITRFEMRRRRVPVHKRDQVQWSTGQESSGGVVYHQLADWLRQRDDEISNTIRVTDPDVEPFLEWLTDECHKYGRGVSPGIAALYWRWYHAEAPQGLDRARFARRRREMIDLWESAWLDGEIHAGPTLVQEYLWLHQHDWVLQDQIVEAIDEYREYVTAGKLGEWRRKKTRRTSSARRKAIKQLYERALFSAVPPDDALLAPAVITRRARRRSHASG